MTPGFLPSSPEGLKGAPRAPGSSILVLGGVDEGARAHTSMVCMCVRVYRCVSVYTMCMVLCV